MMARGRLRCGSRTSPAAIGRNCQPLYAHKAANIAAPKPAMPPLALPGAARFSTVPVPPNRKTPSATPRIATALATVRIDCTRPPSMTPAQLIAANTAMTEIASSWRGPKLKVNATPSRCTSRLSHS